MMLLIVITLFVSTPVAGAPDTPLSRKFDEFADICCEDERARLDAFALALQKEPGAQGYIIFYGGQRILPAVMADNDVVRSARALARPLPVLLDLDPTWWINAELLQPGSSW